MSFFSPESQTEVKNWTKPVKRIFVDSSWSEQIQQDLFKLFWTWQTSKTAPNSTLFFKDCDDDAKVGVTKKVPFSRKKWPARTKFWGILRKEPPLETKNSQPERERERAAAKITIRSRASPFFFHFHLAECKNKLV